MTVIVHTNPFDTPCLISDILISGNEDEKTLELPNHTDGIGDIFPKGSGFIPIKIRRKSFIINPRIAVGLAGSVIHMGAFIQDFLDKFSSKEVQDVLEILQYIEIYGKSDHGENVLSNISALIIYRTRESTTHFVVTGKNAQEDCAECDTKTYGKVIAIGTGNKTLVEEVERLDSYQVFSLNEEVEYSHYLPIMNNLILISQILTIDSITVRAILEYWGGGFEIIFFNFKDEEFQYLEDYSIVFWILDTSKENCKMDIQSIYKYEHRKEFSLIFTYDHNDLKIFGVKDVNKHSLKEVELLPEEITFNSKIFMNLVIVTDGKNPKGIYNFCDQHYDGYPGSVFTKKTEQGDIKIIYDQKAIEFFTQQVIQRELEKQK